MQEMWGFDLQVGMIPMEENGNPYPAFLLESSGQEETGRLQSISYWGLDRTSKAT